MDRGSHRRLDCLSRAWLHRRSVGGAADDQRLLSRSLSRDREQREGKIQITFRTPPAQATSGAPRGSVSLPELVLAFGCTNECRPALTISKHGAKPIGSLFGSGVRRVRGGLSYGHRDLNLEGTAGIQAQGGARTQAHRCRQVRGPQEPCRAATGRGGAGVPAAPQASEGRAAITARCCRGAGATRPPQRAGPAILGSVGAIDAGAPALLALELCSGKRMGSSAMSWRHVATEDCDLHQAPRRRLRDAYARRSGHLRLHKPRSTCCVAWACARATRQPGAPSRLWSVPRRARRC